MQTGVFNFLELTDTETKSYSVYAEGSWTRELPGDVVGRIDGQATHVTTVGEKLLSAGAAYLVSPPMIGGMRIASELVRPQVVSFLDRMLRSEKDAGLRIEDLCVPGDSPYVGKTLTELYQKTGVLVIAFNLVRDRLLRAFCPHRY